MNFNEMIMNDPLMKPILEGENYQQGRDLALLLAQSRLSKMEFSRMAKQDQEQIQRALAGHPQVTQDEYDYLTSILIEHKAALKSNK